MQTSVTFKNLDPSDHLKSYVGDKLDRFDKLLDNPAEANVVLAVEKFRHIAEINIAGDRLSIIGKEETNDMYSAIDMVLDKIEKQIKKNKQKIRKHRASANNKAKTMAVNQDLSYADEEQKDRGLEDVETDHLLYQMSLGDEDEEPGHHEKDDDPVIVETEYPVGVSVTQDHHCDRSRPAKE